MDSHRHYHPETILAVYVVKYHSFVLQRLDALPWDASRHNGRDDIPAYTFNLNEFVSAADLFPQLTADMELQFLQESKSFLSLLGR